MSITVRFMEPGDLDAVVDIFLACWQTDYRAVLPESVITAMTEERGRALWSKRAGTAIVAVDGAGVIGVSRFGLDTDGAATVFSLYVSPQARRGGVGKDLLAAAETGLVGSGAQTGVLWVFASNTPSIDFYARGGWSPDGHTRTEDEWPAEQLRLSKALSSAGVVA